MIKMEQPEIVELLGQDIAEYCLINNLELMKSSVGNISIATTRNDINYIFTYIKKYKKDDNYDMKIDSSISVINLYKKTKISDMKDDPFMIDFLKKLERGEITLS